MNEEIWKPITIKGNIYRDWYDISNFGRSRSWYKSGVGGIKLNIPKILKLGINSHGYKTMSLCINKKPKTFNIHRLVAHEFLGLRPKGLEINHLDGNKLNNNVSNLEYCSQSENSNHAIRLGNCPDNKGEKHGMNKLTEKQVLDIRKRYESEDISQRTLAKIYEISQGQIGRIINKKQWKHF